PAQHPDRKTPGLGRVGPAPLLELDRRHGEAEALLRDPHIERGRTAGADEDHPRGAPRAHRDRAARLVLAARAWVADREAHALDARLVGAGAAATRGGRHS